MTRLIWDAVADRNYENGVSQGVLYPPDEPGVVWNGLISIAESYVGGDISPLYYDGVKYVNLPSGKDFQGTIQAFSAPEEFSACVGEVDLVPGFALTAQPRSLFRMSYKTQVNGDKDYKIHLLYNVTATPGARSHVSIKENVTATIYSWKIDCVSPITNDFVPTAHLIVDSSKSSSANMTELEDLLYGISGDPMLPNIDDLIDIFSG